MLCGSDVFSELVSFDSSRLGRLKVKFDGASRNQIKVGITFHFYGLCFIFLGPKTLILFRSNVGIYWVTMFF